MQLEKLSALQIGELVNKGELSPVEVIKYFAARIEKRNPSINAFVYLKLHDALREAAELEERISNGEYCGPFAGVPVCLKDFLPSKKGWTNTHGGVEAMECIDTADSMFYEAAREMGAIAIGKTNAPAFGFRGTCDNEMYGPTHNPFGLEYNSGGSSGGTAAAVGDCLVPLGEGGDAGGSIRIPSAWCNCFGFKSSLGTVPSYCRPDGWAATHPYCFNGAITRTVEDSAAIMNHMAKYNPRDPISLPINANKDFTELMKKDIKDLKIAVTSDFDLFAVDKEISECVLSSAKKFQEAGAQVDYVHFNFKHSLVDMARCWCWSISLDSHLDLEELKEEGIDLVNDYSNQLTPEFIYWDQKASEYNLHMMREFNEIRTDILDAFEDVFEEYDLIISPVSCCKPLTDNQLKNPIVINGIELPYDINFIAFAQTFIVNFIGYPAASVPCGYTKEGLPIGMQIIGRQYRDEDVFAASYTFEKLQPWDYERSLNRM